MRTIDRFRLPGRPRRRVRSRGQAVVEFALILPVFLLMTLGVVDMARMFTSYISLTNGVSSAAIYAGNGGYTKWCSDPINAADKVVPCPAGTAIGQKSAKPDNIAYQIFIESTGLTTEQVVMSMPMCDPGPVACTSTSAGYTTVKITATYHFTFLTPLVSNLIGNITMTASTSAAVLN